MTTPLSALRALHARVDADWSRLAALHGARLRCGAGCSSCCVDDLTVFAIEAERIRQEYARVLAQEDPAPAGMCAMLDATGRCRVYDARPYVCRTQGLPLRWWAEDDDGEIIEERDICPLNLDGPALELLDDDACWQLGPIEQELADLQAALDGGTLERVALRGLFAR
jgi:hypothetical protein